MRIPTWEDVDMMVAKFPTDKLRDCAHFAMSLTGFCSEIWNNLQIDLRLVVVEDGTDLEDLEAKEVSNGLLFLVRHCPMSGGWRPCYPAEVEEAYGRLVRKLTKPTASMVKGYGTMRLKSSSDCVQRQKRKYTLDTYEQCRDRFE